MGAKSLSDAGLAGLEVMAAAGWAAGFSFAQRSQAASTETLGFLPVDFVRHGNVPVMIWAAAAAIVVVLPGAQIA